MGRVALGVRRSEDYAAAGIDREEMPPKVSERDAKRAELAAKANRLELTVVDLAVDRAPALPKGARRFRDRQ